MNCRIMKTESDEQIRDLPEDIPMAKELSEMSLEVGLCFPIFLVPPPAAVEAYAWVENVD